MFKKNHFFSALLLILFIFGCGGNESSIPSQNLNPEEIKAELVTVKITATVDLINDPENIFEGSVKIGDEISAVYTINKFSEPDPYPQQYSETYYKAINGGDFNMTVGNLCLQNSYYKEDYAINQVSMHNNLKTGDLAIDSWAFYLNEIITIPPKEGDFGIFITLNDESATALNSGDLIPLPDIRLFNFKKIGFTKTVTGTYGPGQRSIVLAEITSMIELP